MDIAALQMWFTFAVIFIAIALFATERLRLEIACAWVVAVFLLFFYFLPVEGPDKVSLISPEKLLAGFANPALITVLLLLIIGQGLYQTSAFEAPTRQLIASTGLRPSLVVPALLAVVCVNSAFLNDTPVVVMYLPVLSAIALKMRMSVSKVLMPLSFVAILGGTTTLMGSSTNLLVAGVAVRSGLPQMGFFDITPIAVVVGAVGAVYVIFLVPRMLAPRATMAEEVTGHGGKQFIAQITVGDGHPLVGAKPVAGMFTELKDMTVRVIQRGEHPFLPPFDDFKLRPGDVIIVAATRSVLTEALTVKGGVLSVAIADDSEDESTSTTGALSSGVAQLMLAEAVIAPGSRMIGRTIEQSGLRADTGCIVLGIQRRSRMIRMRLAEIRLEAGDVILVMGNREQVQSLRLSRDLLLLEWSAAELPMTEKARLALGIFAAVVLTAATGLLPIVISAFVGALAMIAAGCLNVRQATRAFDRRIYLLIGASLAMALSLEATGGAVFLAHRMLDFFAGSPVWMILSAFFLLVAMLTNILTNNATAVLFTPIAISIAQGLNTDPLPFLIGLIIAANCSFASPIGYQTNLLVMGPGHYRFSDFTKVGLPLIVLLWAVFSLYAPWYFGLF